MKRGSGIILGFNVISVRSKSSCGEAGRSRVEMVLVTLVKEYVGKLLQDISGMKVLILDSQTVRSIAVLSLLTVFILFCY